MDYQSSLEYVFQDTKEHKKGPYFQIKDEPIDFSITNLKSFCCRFSTQYFCMIFVVVSICHGRY
jgi:hypothetical protein